MKIGQKMRAAREALGYNTTEAAAAVGWDRSRLSNYERDKRTPNMDDLLLYARVMRVPINYFYGEAVQDKSKGVILPTVKFIGNYNDLKGVISMQPNLKTKPSKIQLIDSKPLPEPTLAYKMVGSSMTNPNEGSRSIYDGDDLIVYCQHTAEVGDLVLLKIPNSDVLIIREYQKDGDSVYFKAFDPSLPIIFHAEICAVVTHLSRKFV